MMQSAPVAPGSTERLDRLKALVDEAMVRLVDEAEPADLYDPVRYVLAGQGKRIRPLLLLLAGETFGVDATESLEAALAVEVFHNFTLVHDDIMDHSATRRGRATVHVRWDESVAILCGDYLHALAYDLLVRVERGDARRVVRTFHRMVARLCEGQALDKAFESRLDVSVDEYLHMVDCKTGALLEASLEIGGLIGEAPEHALATLRQAGRLAGRAFQIQDDLLDLVAEDERWGKTVGGDLVEGKKTYLLLRVLERTAGEDREWFRRIVRQGGLERDRIPEARARMEAAGVLAEARHAVDEHSTAALEALGRLPDTPAATALRQLVSNMRVRLH